MEIRVGTVHSDPYLHTTLLPSSPLMMVPTQAPMVSAFQHPNTSQILSTQRRENFNRLTFKHQSVPLEVRWSRQSLMKERQLPQILFRENPSPGGISYNPADNGSSPKDWGRLRKKKQTAPPCGRGLSILTCYFHEGRGERRVISTKQATRWKANHNFLPPFSPQISWNDQK